MLRRNTPSSPASRKPHFAPRNSFICTQRVKCSEGPGSSLRKARRRRIGGLVISNSDNLDADSFRIFDMKSRIKVVFRTCPTFLQFPCH